MSPTQQTKLELIVQMIKEDSGYNHTLRIFVSLVYEILSDKSSSIGFATSLERKEVKITLPQ